MCSFLLTKRASQNNESRGQSSESYSRIDFAFALCLICVVAFSCGGKSVGLKERATEYWKARIEKRVEQAYEFEAPGKPDKQTYLNKILAAPVTYTSCTIRSIKENGNEAVVDLQLGYLLPGLSRPVSSSMTDKWMRDRGQWYHRFPSDDTSTDTERR